MPGPAFGSFERQFPGPMDPVDEGPTLVSESTAVGETSLGGILLSSVLEVMSEWRCGVMLRKCSEMLSGRLEVTDSVKAVLCLLRCSSASAVIDRYAATGLATRSISASCLSRDIVGEVADIVDGVWGNPGLCVDWLSVIKKHHVGLCYRWSIKFIKKSSGQ